MSVWRSLVISTSCSAADDGCHCCSRKQDQRQKAMDAFFEAFGIDGMEPGDPARAISREGVVILVYRSEEKNEQD